MDVDTSNKIIAAVWTTLDDGYDASDITDAVDQAIHAYSPADDSAEVARFRAKVTDAIERVDAVDTSMLYVQSFVIAESGVPKAVMQWHEDRWQETTRAELIELWKTWGLEGP